MNNEDLFSFTVDVLRCGTCIFLSGFYPLCSAILAGSVEHHDTALVKDEGKMLTRQPAEIWCTIFWCTTTHVDFPFPVFDYWAEASLSVLCVCQQAMKQKIILLLFFLLFAFRKALGPYSYVSLEPWEVTEEHFCSISLLGEEVRMK